MDLPAQRAQFAKDLSDMRASITAHGGDLAEVKRSIAVVMQAQQAMEKAQTDANRDASDRAAQGSERDLRKYTVVSDQEVRANPRSYNLREGKAVGGQLLRLTGHQTRDGGWKFGLLDDPNPRHESQLQLQRALTERALVRAHMAPERRASPICDDKVLEAMSCLPREMRERIFTDGANLGAEWIPDNTYAELEREVQHQTGLHSIFDQRALPPGGSMKLPYREGNLRPYISTAPAANDPAVFTRSDWTTRSQTIDGVKWAVATQMDRDALEDSIIAVMPEVTQDIARAFSFGDDDVVVNGDTAGTHQDAIASWNTRGIWGSTGLGSTADHRRSGIGLRARGFDISNTTDQNGAKTLAGAATALSNLGPEYYARMWMGDIIALTSPEYAIGTMFGWDEFETWNGAGDRALALTGLIGGRNGALPGQIGFLWGVVPVLISPFVTKDLASTGLYTGSGTTTSLIMFSRSDFERRIRYGMNLELETKASNDTVTLYSKKKDVFRTRANDTSGNKKNVHVSFNL